MAKQLMITRSHRLLIIARCRCGLILYDTDIDWSRMNTHIRDYSARIHKWVYVPDVVVFYYPKRRK